MNRSLKLKMPVTVTSADTDMYARLKLSALVNYLIQAAIQSAEQLGFGLNELQRAHLFWVLNRLTIEVQRPVKWNEKLEIETWPKNIERIFYLRDFIVRDETRNIIAKASSAWLAIDLSSKKPANFDKEKMAIFSRLKDHHALPYSPEKLTPIKGCQATCVTPSYFDIDLNKHVTSTRYIDWMMDIFPLAFHAKHYPSLLSINYTKETMPGETLQIHQASAEQTHSFEGFNTIQNKVAFRGKIEF